MIISSLASVMGRSVNGKLLQQTGMQAFRNKRFLNLHEYQAAELLSNYKVPILIGQSASTIEDAVSCARDLEKKSKSGLGLVIKAQIHAGGRGRGTFKESGLQGGVHLVKSSKDVRFLSRRLKLWLPRC